MIHLPIPFGIDRRLINLVEEPFRTIVSATIENQALCGEDEGSINTGIR